MSSLAAPSRTFRPRRSYLAGVVYDTVGQFGAKLGLVWIILLAAAAVFAPMIANSFPLLVKIKGETISAPFIKYLTPADVTLLVAAVAVFVLFTFCRRVPMPSRFAALTWIVLVTIPLAGWKTTPMLYQTWADVIGPVATWIVAGLIGAIALSILIMIPTISGASAKFKLGVLAGAGALAVLLIVFPVNSRLTHYQQFRELARQDRIEWIINAPIPYSPTDRLRDQQNMTLVEPWWAPPMRSGIAHLFGHADELTADEQHAYQTGHWLGTEENGADLFSRMIHASRIALSIGFIATSIALVIGVTLGGLMGYFSRTVDLIGMRLVEIFEAIPQLYLLLTFVAFFPRNLYIMMAIIGLTSWSGYARFTRAEFLKLRQQDFVQAAVACGLPLRSILFRHMLPNGVAPVLVTASFGVASAILAEAFLSFLGLGLLDDPSWGQMLKQALSPSGGFCWWMAIYPGLAIFLTVFAYNLVGEALRDAIDPHLKKSAHL